MLTLQVWNTSDLAPVSSYNYAVYINRDCIATGTVTGHKRADGWPALVKQIAKEHAATGLPKTRVDALMQAVAEAETATRYACGNVDSKGRTCVKPSGSLHKHKYVRIAPARGKR